MFKLRFDWYIISVKAEVHLRVMIVLFKDLNKRYINDLALMTGT